MVFIKKIFFITVILVVMKMKKVASISIGLITIGIGFYSGERFTIIDLNVVDFSYWDDYFSIINIRIFKLTFSISYQRKEV